MLCQEETPSEAKLDPSENVDGLLRAARIQVCHLLSVMISKMIWICGQAQRDDELTKYQQKLAESNQTKLLLTEQVQKLLF